MKNCTSVYRQPYNSRRTQKPEKPRAPHRTNKDEGDLNGEPELEHRLSLG